MLNLRLLILAAGAISLAFSAADDLQHNQEKARLLLAQGDFKGALEQASAYNRSRPDDIPGYQMLAAAHLGLGNYEEADKALQWMLDLRIGRADANGWLLLSRFREVTGDFEGALEAVNAGYGLLPPGQEAAGRTLMTTAGRLLRLSGKLDLAERAIQKVLSPAPGDPMAVEELGLLRMAQARRQEAEVLLRRAAELNAHPRVLYRLAMVSGEPGDVAAFERSARQRMALPENANRELVLYLAGAGKRPAEAVEIARREAGLRHDIGTMDALAVALFAAGQQDEARRVIKAVLEVGTRDPEILGHAARMGIKTD